MNGLRFDWHQPTDANFINELLDPKLQDPDLNAE
jgi:hypothetical protein